MYVELISQLTRGVTIAAMYTQCGQFKAKGVQLFRVKTRWIVFRDPSFIFLSSFFQTYFVIISSGEFGPNVEKN